MKVLIDTNIILDVLLNRKHFVEKSVKVFESAEKGNIEAYITSNSVTDIVYILRKSYNIEEIRENLLLMFGFIKILNVGSNDIINALKTDITDFEEAVIMECAKHTDMDFIITRNKKDFRDSSVKCITVEEWIDCLG